MVPWKRNGDHIVPQDESGTNDLYLQNQGQAAFIGAPSALTSGVWQHVAIEQYNGTLKAYFGGVAKLSINVTAGFGANTNRLSMGGGYGVGYNCKGYIDQMRVSKIARYKGNFVPPTEPFGID